MTADVGRDGEFAARYADELVQFIESGTDDDLVPAYSLGRAALDGGISALDLIQLHATVTAGLTLTPPDVRRALEFVLQTLAPIDMAARGFVVAAAERRTETARRAAAAQLARALSANIDADELRAAAVSGFSSLFGGSAAVGELDAQGRPIGEIAAATGFATVDGLPRDARDAIAQAAGEDSVRDPAPGVLIRSSSAIGAFVWVQFPAPRRLSVDERILARIMGETFRAAMDRAHGESAWQNRARNLKLAIDSHERVGRAIGILVERHRLTPEAAFDRLVQASQQRQIKLAEIAQRVAETGQEPEDAQ